MLAVFQRCSISGLRFNYNVPVPSCVRLASSTAQDDMQLNDTVKESRPTRSEKRRPTITSSFREAFPDFLPLPNFEWRHPIREKVERLDMLRRRMNLDIPEFYVGSIMAVTCSDPFAPKRANRFVGICIERDLRGLMHTFILRNVIDGFAVEVPYDMYNPMIQSIQILRLEKRPDPHLLYLRDALLEYSTFPFDMAPETLPPGSPVPVNMTKVKLKPPPWGKKWHFENIYGIEEIWDLYHDEGFRRRLKYQETKTDYFKKYDIIGEYRKEIPAEDQHKAYEHILDFEEKNPVIANRPAGKRFTTIGGVLSGKGGGSSSQPSAKSKGKH